MSDPEKPKFQAGATIQIDLDQVQLVDPDAEATGDAAKVRKVAPPPLPPTAMPEVMASAATPAPAPGVGSAAASKTTAQKDPKLAIHLATVIGVVVLAVVAGIVVAWRVRSGSSVPASASGAPSEASPSGTSPAPAAAASSAVLTIPPIEVR